MSEEAAPNGSPLLTDIRRWDNESLIAYVRQLWIQLAEQDEAILTLRQLLVGDEMEDDYAAAMPEPEATERLTVWESTVYPPPKRKDTP